MDLTTKKNAGKSQSRISTYDADDESDQGISLTQDLSDNEEPAISLSQGGIKPGTAKLLYHIFLFLFFLCFFFIYYLFILLFIFF